MLEDKAQKSNDTNVELQGVSSLQKDLEQFEQEFKDSSLTEDFFKKLKPLQDECARLRKSKQVSKTIMDTLYEKSFTPLLCRAVRVHCDVEISSYLSLCTMQVKEGKVLPSVPTWHIRMLLESAAAAAAGTKELTKLCVLSRWGRQTWGLGQCLS